MRSLPIAALVASGVLMTVSTAPIASAGAKPKDPDPVRQGTAPVRASEWWYDALHLDEAHASTTGAGVKVGLLEATLDPTVPELRGQDLRRGPDCGTGTGRSRVLPHSRSVEAAHGTSMAALLIGNGKGTDGGKGLRGVAPGARVTLYGLDSWDALGEQYGCLRHVPSVEIFQPVIDDKQDIVNASFTFLGDDDFKEAIENMVAAGAVVVAATAPRDDPTYYPWSYPGVVSVVAVDRNAKPWAASLPDSQNVIAAPGVGVGAGVIDKSGWHSNVWHDGTSTATAIVSGALALVKAKYPDATGNQLIQQLIHYTGGTRGYAWTKDLGFGIVSVTKMLETSPTQWPDENPLLKGPAWALHDYPMWASSLIDAPAGSTDKWAKAEAASTGAPGDGTSSKVPNKSSDGTPRWLWPAGGLAVVVLGAGAALGLVRRRRAGD